jgi:hypothetical protein
MVGRAGLRKDLLAGPGREIFLKATVSISRRSIFESIRDAASEGVIKLME